MERKLRDALPGEDSTRCEPPCASSCDRCSRPALVALNRDAFVVNEGAETTVDLDGQRAAYELDELALDGEPDVEA